MKSLCVSILVQHDNVFHQFSCMLTKIILTWLFAGYEEYWTLVHTKLNMSSIEYLCLILIVTNRRDCIALEYVYLSSKCMVWVKQWRKPYAESYEKYRMKQTYFWNFQKNRIIFCIQFILSYFELLWKKD